MSNLKIDNELFNRLFDTIIKKKYSKTSATKELKKIKCRYANNIIKRVGASKKLDYITNLIDLL